MSWHLLDWPSPWQQRASWTVPDRLREKPHHGSRPFRRPVVPDPDALLQYIDNAISMIENERASRHLSRLFDSSSLSSSISSSSSTSSSSSSVGYPEKQCDDDTSMVSLSPSARKVSRFKSPPPLPREYINSLLKHKGQEDANPASCLASGNFAQEYFPTGTEGFSPSLPQIPEEDFSDGEDVSRNVDNSDEGEVHDARAADDAYRAACSALSEGNADFALSLLHVALVKCPPDKPNALGKVHRLMTTASQLVEKNSAVLSLLPADKDSC